MTRRAFTATIANRSIHLLAIVVATISPASAFAIELWNYQFTPTGSRPYFSGCDGCLPYLGTRADIAGTFSVALNWQNGTGHLFQLDDQLVNVATLLYSPSGTVVLPNNPPDLDYGIVPPDTILQFPKGVFTYTGGVGQLIAGPYEVWFTPTWAILNMGVPRIGHEISVAGALATFTTFSIAGDFNYDNRVDARDYVQWRKSAGSAADYERWRSSYGVSLPPRGSQSVPEPTAAVLLLCSVAALPRLRRRPHRS
jgi:hypothetical protein